VAVAAAAKLAVGPIDNLADRVAVVHMVAVVVLVLGVKDFQEHLVLLFPFVMALVFLEAAITRLASLLVVEEDLAEQVVVQPAVRAERVQ